MDDIGAEVSLKIRSAIKAKLVELGAYVDDELPDYIMVMVANKRSKAQMDSDLKLFLGSNTMIFTGWLHTVLQKLQEVTIASNLNKQNTHPVAEKPPIKSNKVSSPVEVDDHKHKHKKKQKKSSDGGSKRNKSAESKKVGKLAEGKVTKAVDLTETLDNESSNKVKDIDMMRTSANGKGKDSAKTSKKDLRKSIVAPEDEIKAKQMVLKIPADNKNSVENSGTLVVTKSVSSKFVLEPHIESEKPSSEVLKTSDCDVVMETTKHTKVIYKSTESSPLKLRKPSAMMQSDEEDFEDIINIKDTEMMDFLDAELPEELPKVTPTIVVSPKPTKHDPEMEVDDLEEQRAKLLRDLQRLEKPIKTSRPTIDKYSVTKLLDRHSKTSALNRLGAIVDEPQLKLIDPDEFNIDGPPKEADPPKLRLADRLGKKTVVENEKTVLVMKKSVPSNDRNVLSMKTSLESQLVPRDSLKEDSRRNVLDRLGKRNSPDSDDQRKDYLEKNSTRKEKTVLMPSIDKKVSKEPERKVNVLARLGTRPDHSSTNERAKKILESDLSKSKLGDLLGKVASSSRERPSSGRCLSPREKRVSEERETFKSRFMDRLGKKEGRTSRDDEITKSSGKREPGLAKESERMTIMDRLGKKVTRERDELPDRDSANKRHTRIISIKEALAGEQHHSSGKRASTNLEDKEKDELPRKRLLLSRVIAVKRDPRLNEETDPDVAVASVIRVQPRPKVPAAMQASKNLLLKAMAEAQKSVASAPNRQQVKAEPERLFTRKYRDVAPEKINITLANTKQKSDEDEEMEAVKEEAMVSRTLAIVNQRLRDAATRSAKQGTVQVDGRGVNQWQNKTTNEKSNSKQAAKPAQASPPSVDEQVKAKSEVEDDDEVLEEIYEEDEGDSVVGNVSLQQYSEFQEMSEGVGNVSPLNDIEEDDIVVDNEEYVPSKAQYSTEDEPELQNNYNNRRSNRAGNTQFVVTLDGLDPLTMFNSRKRTVEQQHTERPASPLPVPEHERIHNWLISLERAKEEKERTERTTPPVVYKKPRLASTVEVASAISKPVKTAVTERCKYWPACRQGDHCEYLHPTTITCKSFPSCKYGDKCLYIHPTCKFDTSCTRRECPYLHPGVRLPAGPVQAVLPLSRVRTSHPQPVCKFYPKCSNVNCAFQHPMPCRFGRSCTKPDCVFFHEEIPSTEKLKWVKTN